MAIVTPTNRTAASSSRQTTASPSPPQNKLEVGGRGEKNHRGEKEKEKEKEKNKHLMEAGGRRRTCGRAEVGGDDDLVRRQPFLGLNLRPKRGASTCARREARPKRGARTSDAGGRSRSCRAEGAGRTVP